MSYPEILKILQKRSLDIKNLGVRRIGVFGSASCSALKPASDIDILVEFNTGQKNFDNYMDLRFLLEKLFKRKIDLVVKDALKKRLKPRVLKEVKYARL